METDLVQTGVDGHGIAVYLVLKQDAGALRHDLALDHAGYDGKAGEVAAQEELVSPDVVQPVGDTIDLLNRVQQEHVVPVQED